MFTGVNPAVVEKDVYFFSEASNNQATNDKEKVGCSEEVDLICLKFNFLTCRVRQHVTSVVSGLLWVTHCLPVNLSF